MHKLISVYGMNNVFQHTKNKKTTAVPTKTPSTENNQLRGHGNDLPIAIILSELADYNTEF